MHLYDYRLPLATIPSVFLESRAFDLCQSTLSTPEALFNAVQTLLLCLTYHIHTNILATMRSSLATIAMAALIFSASAIPHRGHGKGRNSTQTIGEKGRGAGRDHYLGGDILSGVSDTQGTATPTGHYEFSGKSYADAPNTAPTALPVDGFDPGNMGKFVGISRAKSDDSDSDKSPDSNKSDSKEDSEESGNSSNSSKGGKDKKEGSSDNDDTSDEDKKSSGSEDEKDSSDSEDGKSSSGSDKDKSSSNSGSNSDNKDTSSGSGNGNSSSEGSDSDDKGSSSGKGSNSGGKPSGGSSNSTAPSTPSMGGSAASGTFPTAAGESTLSAPMEVTNFDGGMKKFGRGVTCSSGEGGDSDAVFIVADGGTLSNVIIGADQKEGVHCAGACTIKNVWWEAVCEDALSFKGNGDGTVTGGGAKGAKDKVVQHNGVGTISISGFHVEDFGKLYRSCGNCKTVSIISSIF